MQIQESGEMYLETIFVLSKTKDIVRAIDVSEYMGFSKPSVSRAMSLLRDAGLLSVDANGALILTESGLQMAQKIYERHSVLSSLLVKLGVDEKTAAEDACKIEHHISDETMSAIKRFVEEQEIVLK